MMRAQTAWRPSNSNSALHASWPVLLRFRQLGNERMQVKRFFVREDFMNAFERTMRKVVKRENGCWEFTGAKNENGYGIVGLGKRSEGVDRAHRVIYREICGPILDGMFVCHKCDNPPCCNPEHLFLGTAQENNSDMRAKGRGSCPPRNLHLRGSNHYIAKLNEDLVVEMRSRNKAGASIYSLAKDFGVSYATVYNAVHRKTWKHV